MPAVAENESVSLSYMFIACMFQITMERSRNSFSSLHFKVTFLDIYNHIQIMEFTSFNIYKM